MYAHGGIEIMSLFVRLFNDLLAQSFNRSKTLLEILSLGITFFMCPKQESTSRLDGENSIKIYIIHFRIKSY
jgi:hypothetical protein